MRYSLFVVLVAASAVLLAADRAAAQSNCSNGMCWNVQTPSFSLPVEASVVPVEKMGPLEQKIVQIEKNALEKWYAGDPSAYIAMIGDGIGYFEPILEKRLDGREPLRKMYETLRGRAHADRFDMLNTRVQASEKMAVLSFNLITIEGGVPYRWNCTEVFSPDKSGQWKLIHSHWSHTKPQVR